MNHKKRNIGYLILVFALMMFGKSLQAQEGIKRNFIGVNPSVTIEPFYEKGEMDINVFPIVYTHSLGKNIDLRLSSILNYGIRNSGNEISHLGFEAAAQFYMFKKEEDISNGFFLAPMLSFTRNRIAKHNNLGLWIEPGYNLLFDNEMALSFGLQLGTTYFKYDAGETKWGPHFGIKIIFGKWLF